MGYLTNEKMNENSSSGHEMQKSAKIIHFLTDERCVGQLFSVCVSNRRAFGIAKLIPAIFILFSIKTLVGGF